MKRPFFILGTGRCGTTRLAEALQSHRHVALTNESRVVDFLYFCSKWASLPDDSIEWFEFEAPAELRGIVTREYTDIFKKVFIEQARQTLLRFYETTFHDKAFTHFGDKLANPFAVLAFQSYLPETKAILMVRDPRDFVCSARAYASRADISRAYSHLNVSVEEHARHWQNYYGGAPSHLKQYQVLRYEDFLQDPEEHLTAVLSFLELDKDPACFVALQEGAGFQAHATSPSLAASMGRWRDELTAPEVSIIEELCGDAMSVYNYATESAQ